MRCTSHVRFTPNSDRESGFGPPHNCVNASGVTFAFVKQGRQGCFSAIDLSTDQFTLHN
jgi:hypothetical protein